MPYTNFRLNESEVAASFGQLWGQCSIWRNSFDAKVGVAFSVTCLHLTVSSYYQHLLVLLLSIMPRCRWSNIYYRVLLCHFYVCNRRDVDVTNALSLVRCSCVTSPFPCVLDASLIPLASLICSPAILSRLVRTHIEVESINPSRTLCVGFWRAVFGHQCALFVFTWSLN